MNISRPPRLGKAGGALLDDEIVRMRDEIASPMPLTAERSRRHSLGMKICPSFRSSSVAALALAISMLVGSGARAAAPPTFYVEVGGNDANTGSIGDPWATITHALTGVSDGSLILVGPGVYAGRVTLSGRFSIGVTVRAEPRYGALLQATSQQAIICFACEGITLEGFEVSHGGPGASALVVQIQDASPGDGLPVGRMTLRDNIFHDSYNNDIVKVNNAATDVLITGNMFYNQAGSDEHMDINSVTGVVIEDNVLFNDFAGSGRSDNSTSSFIVIKDSNGASDGIVGSSGIVVRRNVFLHWEGSSGQGFVRVGEDGTATFEADGVLIENNLMLGNNTQQIRSPLQFQGVRDVVARANTIAGTMPAKEFGFRIVTGGSNPDSEDIAVYNNIWSDPTGTMGDTFNRGSATTNLAFDNNLFWNSGNAFPTSSESIVEVADDVSAVIGDPLLADSSAAVLPRFLSSGAGFADGSATIREVFENLVTLYGTPASGSAAFDAADPTQMPSDDILGNDRAPGGAPDIGAVEVASCLTAIDGTACDDGNGCTTSDQCTGGVCAGSNDDGASCDDGNVCTGPDLCSGGACAGVADDGAICDDSDPCTGPDLCSAGSCLTTVAPRNDCEQGTKGKVRLRESSRAGKDLLQWSWSGIDVLIGDLGDPVLGATDYALCLYDEDSGVASGLFSAELPRQGICDGRPCWKALGPKGFRYKSRGGEPDGIRQVKFKVGAKAAIKAKGGRESLVLPLLPLLQSPQIVAQLSVVGGACWQTVLATPADRSSSEEFRDSH
jgi:hypothetical protein